MKKNKPKPKYGYAIATAKYAVIVNGRRMVLFHLSGQPLQGRIAS